MNYVSNVVSPVLDLNEIIHKPVALLDGPMVHSLLHVEENNFLEKAVECLLHEFLGIFTNLFCNGRKEMGL